MAYYLKQITWNKEENPIILKLENEELIIGRSTPGLKGYHFVSMHHASLEELNGQVFIQDMNSTNGVYVNGNKITPGRKLLEVGDIIGFGVPNSKFNLEHSNMGLVFQFSSEETCSEIIVDDVKLNPVTSRQAVSKTETFPDDDDDEIELVDVKVFKHEKIEYIDLSNG